MTNLSISTHDLGRMSFAEAWELQRTWHERIVRGKQGKVEPVAGALLLVEHPHVFTLGRITDSANVLATDADLKQIGAEKFEIDRGGDVTYHGPGQLVGYPILDLSLWKEDLHWYLRSLEESIIGLLGRLDVEGYRVPGRTGVWVRDKKICAIGIKCSSWVTMHGFAFNVNTDLSFFNKIIPCGIADKGVTSLAEICPSVPTMDVVKKMYRDEFGRVFSCDLSPAQIHAA